MSTVQDEVGQEHPQSAWMNLWCVRQSNDVVVLIWSRDPLDARSLSEVTGFRAFGWLEDQMRPHLIPGVPRQLLYYSEQGFLWADQFNINDGPDPIRNEYRAWLGASLPTYSPGLEEYRMWRAEKARLEYEEREREIAHGSIMAVKPESS